MESIIRFGFPKWISIVQKKNIFEAVKVKMKRELKRGKM